MREELKVSRTHITMNCPPLPPHLDLFSWVESSWKRPPKGTAACMQTCSRRTMFCLLQQAEISRGIARTKATDFIVVEAENVVAAGNVLSGASGK